MRSWLRADVPSRAGNESGRTAQALEWGPPARRHRDQVAEIVAETGLFREEETDIALEVFDSFCEAPDADYSALAAFQGSDMVAGFALYGPTPCTVATWDVYWIVVRPRFQRAGIGRQLLRAVEERMVIAGAALSVIETSGRADYRGTRQFYLANGYEEVGRIADFYDLGDDRVTFAKRLRPEASGREK